DNFWKISLETLPPNLHTIPHPSPGQLHLPLAQGTRAAVMLVEDRRKQVLELVKGRGFITLTDLAREVGVSESTARRDLDHWQGRGLLKRIHGGAMSGDDGQG